MKIFHIFALFKVFQYRSVYQNLYYNILTNNCIANMIMEDTIVQEVISENLDVTDNNMMNDVHNMLTTSQSIESEERKENKPEEDYVYNDSMDNESNNSSSEPLLLLPPSLPISKEDNIHEDRSIKLGETISMDELGPIIVNTDGTLRRIENWDKLSKAEQTNTFRLIAARNKKRIEILKQKENEDKSENENSIL